MTEQNTNAWNSGVNTADGQVTAEVEKEVEQAVRAGRKTALDLALLRTRRDELGKLLESAATGLEPKSPPFLPVYVSLYKTSFTTLESSIEIHDTATSGQRRYSQGTKDSAKKVYDCVVAFRARASERLGHGDNVKDTLSLCGVGTVINPQLPQDILSAAKRQLAAVSDADMATLMKESGLFPDRQKARLDELVPALQDGIHQGTSKEVRKGDATQEVEHASEAELSAAMKMKK